MTILCYPPVDTISASSTPQYQHSPNESGTLQQTVQGIYINLTALLECFRVCTQCFSHGLVHGDSIGVLHEFPDSFSLFILHHQYFFGLHHMTNHDQPNLHQQ